MPPKTQVNSATGIMGVTGSGKSALAATLAKYVWRRWKKITLYYASDGGGFPAPVQEVQALGILRVFRLLTRDPGDLGLSFETCYRACQGWWPRRINPATGEVSPGVEMVPPVALRFEMRCPAGHLIKTVPSESLLLPTVCPTCKKMIGKTEMRVTKATVQNAGFEDVGAVFFDGLSSMLAWEMRELGHRAGRMELRGEEAAIGGKVASGDLKFGGTTRSHVGFAQTRGEELVHLTLGIPNLVVPPVFTMLTHEDVDERSLSIIGPKIAGRAKTDEAPQWFGNMLETSKIPALEGSGEQRILYLSEFTDPRGVRHLLKHRGSPGTMPSYLVDPVGGDDNPEVAFSQVNLGVFFEMLDNALDRGIAAARVEFPDAPGVPEGLVEIGGSRSEPGPITEGETVPVPLAAGPQTLQAPATGPATGPAMSPAAPAAPAVRRPRRGAVQAATPAPVEVTPAIPAAPAQPPAPTTPAAAPPVAATGAPVQALTGPAQVGSQPATAVSTPSAAPTRPAGAAPPPGRRPSPSAPRMTAPLGSPAPAVPSSTPAAVSPVPAPVSPVPAAATPSTPGPTTQPGTPGGARVSGPSAPRTAPRVTATAPRAPAAAPRPPAATPVQPTRSGTDIQP